MPGVDTVFRTCPTCEASCGLVLAVDRDRNEVVSINDDKVLDIPSGTSVVNGVPVTVVRPGEP